MSLCKHKSRCKRKSQDKITAASEGGKKRGALAAMGPLAALRRGSKGWENRARASKLMLLVRFESGTRGGDQMKTRKIG